MSESRRSMKVRLALLLSLLGILPCAFLLARAQSPTAQGTAAPPVPNVVSAWYTFQPGDTWVYQKESDDGGNTGGMAHPLIERWKTQETIASVRTIPEGTFVTKRTKVLDQVMLNGWLAANDQTLKELPESHIVIRQNCVYVLDGIDAEESRDALDAPTHLRPEYHNDLLQGSIPPDVCFPIDNGTTWGRVPSTSPAEEWVWRVKGLNADPFGDRGGRTFHFTAHVGSGTEMDRWFEAGVGVLQEITEHHGHYDEDRRQLLRTVIDGKSRSYDLKPARTVAFGSLECVGVGWKHFVRENGSSFANEDACVVYADIGKHAPK